MIYMNDEYWELLDESRNQVGILHKRGDKIPNGYYHLVVHVWIMSKDGLFLMSQRQAGRPYALKWERTGGSVLFGESSLDGAIREVYEELGIKLDRNNAYFIKSQKRERFKDFFDSWLFVIDKDTKITFQETEVINAKWFTIKELDDFKNDNKLVKSSRYYKEVYDYFLKHTK